MKSLRYISMVLFTLMYSFGCNTHIPANENAQPTQPKISFKQKPTETIAEPVVDSKLIRFDMDFGNTKLAATVNEMGTVVIDNYPKEWHGKASLIRFDGQNGIEFPFSDSHCDSIREMAYHKHMGALVRSGYHALITFETPLFLSYDLMDTITKYARSAGANFTYLYLNNPVDKINSKIELKFSDDSISNQIGNIAALKQQLHLGQKGMLNGPFEQQVSVYSADIICDLISGAATMSMFYSVQGQDQVITVVYEPMKVKINNPRLMH